MTDSITKDDKSEAFLSVMLGFPLGFGDSELVGGPDGDLPALVGVCPGGVAIRSARSATPSRVRCRRPRRNPIAIMPRHALDLEARLKATDRSAIGRLRVARLSAGCPRREKRPALRAGRGPKALKLLVAGPRLELGTYGL
jgi:hypothetical protein